MVYLDPDEWVRQYFRASIYNNLDEFNFSDAFDCLMPFIHQKLAEHGCGTLEEFIEYESEFHNIDKELSSFEWDNLYIHITAEDIFNAICEYKYKRANEYFSSLFCDLIDIEKEYESIDYSDYKACMLLMEKIIHAQHASGDIFEDYFNPDDIRAEVEEEYRKEMNGEI